jgi:hypothetical protein
MTRLFTAKTACCDDLCQQAGNSAQKTASFALARHSQQVIRQ